MPSTILRALSHKSSKHNSKEVSENSLVLGKAARNAATHKSVTLQGVRVDYLAQERLDFGSYKVLIEALRVMMEESQRRFDISLGVEQ